jgi:hypothetical protein
MVERTLHLSFAGRDGLVVAIEQDLRKGRAFVEADLAAQGGHAWAERDRAQLVLEHPEAKGTLVLRAEVVWVKRDPPTGLGLALVDAGPELSAELRTFAELSAECAEGEPREGERSLNLYDRIRALAPRARESLARTGVLSERVALERVYGGAVWESLLQNPQLTPPEVARISRNGNLPKPLVSLIVANAGWLAQGEVQRSLLGNPRVDGAALERVLRALRPADLDQIVKTASYRAAVRTAAARLRGR